MPPSGTRAAALTSRANAPSSSGVRDTETRDNGALTFDAAAWRGFPAVLKAGDYDL